MANIPLTIKRFEVKHRQILSVYAIMAEYPVLERLLWFHEKRKSILSRSGQISI